MLLSCVFCEVSLILYANTAHWVKKECLCYEIGFKNYLSVIWGLQNNETKMMNEK